MPAVGRTADRLRVIKQPKHPEPPEYDWINKLEVRDTCETNQWRSNCNGEWRRFYIEEIYRKKMNKDLYNQKDMDVYMKFKNNIYHNTFLGEAWYEWSINNFNWW